MSAATKAKADRLLAEGRVEPDPTPARIFQVEGDTGTYTTVVGARMQMCSCPHGTNGAGGACSHIEAAVEWVLAEAAQEEAIRRYVLALAARKVARDCGSFREAVMPHPNPQTVSCLYGDPACPCADGGSCHYRPTATTEAWKPPREWWREVPCGHPMDPVAWRGPDGPVCHCGTILDDWPQGFVPALDDSDGEWPVEVCEGCGCIAAVPPDPAVEQ